MEERTNMGTNKNHGRMAEELLAGTPFKDSLRLFLNNIDPESGPALVRTIMGRDVEVTLAVTSALPAMANFLIGAAMELVVQVRGKYPAPLLAGMAESLLQDVDRETLVCLIREIRALGRDLAPAFNAFAQAIEEKSPQGKERA